MRWKFSRVRAAGQQGSETPLKGKSKGAGMSAAKQISYIALSVAVITVCSWISIPIAQIPVTLQTFAVALIGGLLGWKRGAIAVAVYVLTGLVGIPVFSGFKAGAAALFGPTGGYIFGFFFSALITGFFRMIPVKNKWARTGVLYGANVLGLAVCYLFGTLWFMQLTESGLAATLALCVLPFLLPDAVKLLFAALLTVRLERYIK